MISATLSVNPIKMIEPKVAVIGSKASNKLIIVGLTCLSAIENNKNGMIVPIKITPMISIKFTGAKFTLGTTG